MSETPSADAGQKEWLASVFDRAAPTYDRVGDAYHDYFGARLVDVAGVDAGARVLDVACGRGAVLVPAAARVGREGRVVGVDLSPAMVDAARTAIEGVDAGPEVELAVMDAEQLQFDADSFDHALCAFGVFFFPAPERAASELLRVLAPGGTAALSTWTGRDERWAWEDELVAQLGASRRAMSRPFGQPTEVVDLLTAAGFATVTTTLEHHDISFADEDQWWDWKWSYSMRGMLEQADDATLGTFRRAAFAAMQPLRERQGFPMRLTACFTLGHKPA